MKYEAKEAPVTSPSFLDDINLAIVRHLWNGRKPYAEIAGDLGLATNTVRRRVNYLTEAGILQIIGLVDPKAVPRHRSVFMDFKVEPNKIDQTLNQIGQMKSVVMAGWVSGRFDVMAVVFFNHERLHERLVIEELRKVDGLLAVETFYVERGVNWQLRYVSDATKGTG
jgi:Lrp/AsnC family transcriptional regulator for asnA, asnC and gidA